MGTANLEGTPCTWEGTDAISGGGCHSCLYYSLLWHFFCLLSTFSSWFHFQSYLCTLADGWLSGYILFPGGVQSQDLSENTPAFGLTHDIVWVTSGLNVIDTSKIAQIIFLLEIPPCNCISLTGIISQASYSPLNYIILTQNFGY